MITYIGKQIREKKGIGLRELARKANVSSGTISKWENNIHLPDLYTLDIVAKALDVPPQDLIKFS